MANNPELQVDINTGQVIASLQRALERSGKSAILRVGYSAPYTIFVHENLDAKHDNGQAKFLETPMRSQATQEKMRDAERKALKNKRSLRDALIDAGNVLLRDSLPLVPVDTGFLRDSHFIEIEEG